MSLKDYSGKFRPNLKIRDFSGDALQRLWRVSGDYAIAISRYWTTLVAEKYGSDVALELSKEIWLKRGGSEMETSLFSEAMNIHGDDVETYFKLLQVDPGFSGMEAEYDLKSKKHGVFTVKKCYALKVAEETGASGLQKHLCEELDGVGFDLGVKYFNPKMKITPLKLPPRKSPQDTCCQWEVKVEE